MIAKHKRIRDWAYLAWIREQPCCLCGRPAEAAHLRVGSVNHNKTYGGLGLKSSDKWAVPLCRPHHDEQHATGNELEFWARYGINPFELAIGYQQARVEQP
jgi:hypothetical protein